MRPSGSPSPPPARGSSCERERSPRVTERTRTAWRPFRLDRGHQVGRLRRLHVQRGGHGRARTAPPGFRPGAPLSARPGLACGPERPAPFCTAAGRRRSVGSRLRLRPGAGAWLRRKDSNLRRRWVTTTRSPAELPRTVRTGSRRAPGGRTPAFLVCCPPQARRPTGRTGVRGSGRW